MSYGSLHKSTLGNYVITNVDIWNADGEQKGCDVVVEDGFIKQIIPQGKTHHTTQTFDGTDKILLPGGVDPQVHLRVPGQPNKETPETGCAAAIQGGITAMLTMPNTNPVIDEPNVIHTTKELLTSAVEDTGVRIELSAAITRQQKGREAVDFQALANNGIAAFTDDGVGVVSDDLMRLAFRASADTGLPVLQHAEVPGHGGVIASGPVQKALGIKAYPPSAESDMVARDLKLLKEFPSARYHVLHVSSSETLRLVAEAKEKGLSATCEASPHHLFFTSDDVCTSNPAFKMNPPLRSDSDRSALITALREGLVDFVATDHAPHEDEIKTANLKTAAYGTTGMETSLRVLLTLWHRGEISSDRLVQVFSHVPAKFLSLQTTEGTIAKGRPLRAVLVDHHQTATPITTEDLASRSHNNCFLNSFLHGQIVATFVENRVFSRP